MGEQKPEKTKKHICAGLLAHVDSGKTTLSEGLLYASGALRKLGRVDHGDAFLDTDALERARGITIFSKQALLHCAGIVGAGLLYSLGINLFVVPTGLYTGGIMGFAQLLRTLFLHLTGLELKIDIAGIINYAINLPILCIAWKQLDHRVVFKTLLSVTSTTVFMSLLPRTDILHGDQLAECLIGGILCGCGIGITLWMGGTTGGMDVIGMMLIKKGSHTSIGHVNLFWNMALYAILSLIHI